MFNRIVSLGPSVTAILKGIGAWDKVAAVTRHCRHLTSTGELPVIGDCWSAKPEEVQNLKPDLVIGTVPYHPETLKNLLQSGLQIFCFYPKTLADVYKDIKVLGALTDCAAGADQLIQWMKAQIESIRERVKDLEVRPRVYCEEWMKPLMTSAEWVKELVEAAGGIFVPEKAECVIESQDVIKANPEIIILAWCGAEARSNPAKVKIREGWQNIRAVSRSRIYSIPDQYFNSPCQFLITGLQMIAQILHPEIFGVFNPSKILGPAIPEFAV